jgi:hypothetical protein
MIVSPPSVTPWRLAASLTPASIALVSDPKETDFARVAMMVSVQFR